MSPYLAMLVWAYPFTVPSPMMTIAETSPHLLEVTARMAGHDEAAILAMPPGVPVLDVLHTSYNQHGEPFEVTRFVHRADRAGLIYQFPVEG